ncbi:MAG: CBS domain-containing protein [Clostridia bacterium]|nr:CBS domain-containing protein [Clostridia bacterium]
MNKKVCEIMEKDVYACHTSATLGDVLKILVDKKVSGVPIIDDRRQVVGFISDGDIMKYIGRENPQTVDFATYMFTLYDEKPLDEKVKELLDLNVMHLATKKVISVADDWDIDKAACILGKKKIKKAPVLKDGKLVGIISRSQIIRYIAGLVLNKNSQ